MDKTYEIMSIINHFNHKMKELKKNESSLKEQEDTEKLYAQAIQLQCKIPYGHVFIIDDFISLVQEKYFTDYDGHGEFIDFNGFPCLQSIRCDVNWLEENKKDYLFIVWYNK